MAGRRVSQGLEDVGSKDMPAELLWPLIGEIKAKPLDISRA